MYLKDKKSLTTQFHKYQPSEDGFWGPKGDIFLTDLCPCTSHRFWHQVQNLHIKQNLKCGKTTAHIGAEFSGTKSCGFTEEKKAKKDTFPFSDALVYVRALVFKKQMRRAASFPWEKASSSILRKHPRKIRMQCSLLHSSLALCLWLKRLFSLKHRSGQITTFNFCLDKKNMSEKARVETETPTGVEMCMWVHMVVRTARMSLDLYLQVTVKKSNGSGSNGTRGS